MAKKNMDFLVCFLIMVLDIVAGILGIQAEIAQNKVQHLRVWIFECRDPSYQAFNLGLAAVVLLCLAHAVTNLLGGCIFIRSKEELDRSSSNKQLAAASLVLSWIMLGIAFILLVSGTSANSKSRKNCGIAQHRQLSIGGILCFIHGLFAVAYYISAAAVLQEEMEHHQHGDEENRPTQPAAAAVLQEEMEHHQHGDEENRPTQPAAAAVLQERVNHQHGDEGNQQTQQAAPA